jgi:alpha-ribazole phosphatase
MSTATDRSGVSMTDPIRTRIDLIRHGEPVGGRKFRGQVDDPLSPKGWQQMRTAVSDDCPWEAIVTSPLSRCSEFARELSQRRGLALMIEHDFREIGFGEWEGRAHHEIAADDPGCVERFRRDPINERPPGAESLEEFRDRIVSAWDRLLAEFGGRHVLVVCHAGVIRMVMRHALQMPLEYTFRIQVPNAGITRLEVESDEGGAHPKLLFHGALRVTES